MKYIIAAIIVFAVIGWTVYIFKAPKSPIVYEPYALLCKGEYEYYTPGETECFSITRDGKAFASTTVTLGTKFFGEISTSTDFTKMADFIDDLGKEVEIQAVSILDSEYIIHSKIGKILIKGENLDAELSNISTFLKDQTGKIFEYIDARHGNSIFFK